MQENLFKNKNLFFIFKLKEKKKKIIKNKLNLL
jgi:hypothetical protein